MCHFYSSTAAVAASLCILILIVAASQANEGKQKDKSTVYETDSSKGIVLSRNEANTYHKDGHRSKRFIFGGNLAEECYYEGCDKHEVQEVLGFGQAAEEYYKDYRCSLGAFHYCKVTCHYRKYCSYTVWSQWSGSALSTRGCSTQSRFKSHMYPIRTTIRRGNCGSLDDKCWTPPQQERLWCKCVKVECQYGQWSNWIGDIHDGKCTVQTRTKPYTLLLKTVSKVGSCQDSVQNTCQQKEFRTRCSCLKANCLLKQWTSWHTVNSVRECDVQTRTRYYKTSYVYLQRAQDCTNVRKDCPPPISSNRTICNCTYRSSCQLKKWSSWSPNIIGAGCEKQNRTRNYIQQLNYARQLNNCVGLNTCKEILEETRNWCSYRKANCLLREWTSWHTVNSVRECDVQTRTRYYKTSYVYEQRAQGCTNVQKDCPPAISRSRTICNCTYRSSCHLTKWSSWSPNISGAGCKKQNRTRNYIQQLNYARRLNNCVGLNTCKEILEETRNWCNCTYRSSCQLTVWSRWNPNIIGTGCEKQIRTRNFIQQSNYAQQLNNCMGLNMCKEKLEETRNLCVCMYRKSCELKDWSEWNNAVTEYGCKNQTRTRVYRFPLKHIQDNGCAGLVTTYIDEPVKQERTLCKCKYVENKEEKHYFQIGKCSNEEVKMIHAITPKEYNRTDFKIPFIISLFFAVLFLIVIVIAIWRKHRSSRKSFQSSGRRSQLYVEKTELQPL